MGYSDMAVVMVLTLVLSGFAAGATGPETSSVENISTDLSDGYDYDDYAPGEYVKRYRKNDFPEDIDKEGEAYAEKSFMAIAIYILVFCLIWMISLCCWSCGMMQCCIRKNCCCAKCCADPPGCMKSKVVGLVVFVVVIVLAVILFSMSVAGLANEETQDDEITKLGRIIDVAIDWGDATDGKIETTKAAYSAVQSSVDDVELAGKAVSSGGQCPYEPIAKVIAEQIPDIAAALNASSSTITELDTSVAETASELKKQRDSMDDAVQEYNEPRHQAVLWVYSLVLILMVVTVVFLMLKKLAPKVCGAGFMGCISGLCSFIVLLLLLLLSIVSVLLAFIVVVYADFCYEPIQATLSATKMDPADKLYFYIQCGQNASAVNPFNADCITAIDEMGVAIAKIDTLTDAVNAANAAAPSGTSDAQTCSNNVMPEINELKTAAVALEGSLGARNSTLGYETGLFSQLHCDQLHFRFDACINQLCDAVFNPLAISFELIFSIVCFFFLLEVARRWLRPTQDEKGKTKVTPGPDSEKPAAEKKAKASPGPDSEKPAAEKQARASQTADYIKTAASTPDQATGSSPAK